MFCAQEKERDGGDGEGEEGDEDLQEPVDHAPELSECFEGGGGDAVEGS